MHSSHRTRVLEPPVHVYEISIELLRSIHQTPAPSNPRVWRERQVCEISDEVIIEPGSTSVQRMHVYSSTMVDKCTLEMN